MQYLRIYKTEKIIKFIKDNQHKKRTLQFYFCLWHLTRSGEKEIDLGMRYKALSMLGISYSTYRVYKKRFVDRRYMKTLTKNKPKCCAYGSDGGGIFLSESSVDKLIPLPCQHYALNKINKYGRPYKKHKYWLIPIYQKGMSIFKKDFDFISYLEDFINENQSKKEKKVDLGQIDKTKLNRRKKFLQYLKDKKSREWKSKRKKAINFKEENFKHTNHGILYNNILHDKILRSGFFNELWNVKWTRISPRKINIENKMIDFNETKKINIHSEVLRNEKIIAHKGIWFIKDIGGYRRFNLKKMTKAYDLRMEMKEKKKRKARSEEFRLGYYQQNI